MIHSPPANEPSHRYSPVPAVLAALALALAAVPAPAAEFHVDDPEGDDYGAGDLIYPNRGDLNEGDLDLVRFRAESSGKGTWFAARFRNPIRSPRGQVSLIGQEPLEDVARHDFYTINVDVYIDVDREPGSGNLDTLPGRRVRIHPESAWEKAVIVTPRPNVVRSLFEAHMVGVMEETLRQQSGRVGAEDARKLRRRVAEEIDRNFYFPTRLRVAGRELRFFVPGAWLGGTADPEWGYSVFVTGADVEQQASIINRTTQEANLMLIPAERGTSEFRFGLRSEADIAQPPVVDVLSPDPAVQALVLANYDVVSGRLAAVPAVIPHGSHRSQIAAARAAAALQAPARPPGADGALELDLRTSLPAPRQPPPAAAPSTPPPPSAAAPGTPPAPPRTGAAPTAPAEASQPTFAERLQTLKALYEQGLISEGEYREERARILSEI